MRWARRSRSSTTSPRPAGSRSPPEGAMALRAVQGFAEEVLRPASLWSDSFRQRQVLHEIGHRPWPLPAEPWVMGQPWIVLLFAHWGVPIASLEAVVPPQLTVDTHEGHGYLGITPFRVEG